MNIIYKSKVYISNTETHREPENTQAALKTVVWFKVISEEIQALRNNQTWVLVPFEDNMKILGSKWILE